MDVKGLLEKYANIDEYAKKIFDKLLAQEERIENEKMVFLEWNKSILNRISYNDDYILICGALLTILVFALQLAICELLGIHLMWGSLMFALIFVSVLFIDSLIIFGCWVEILLKRETMPIVNHTLLSDDEITYLNNILYVESIEKIKEYKLVINNDYYYIYEDSYDSLVNVDEYIIDKNMKSIYLYQYYKINNENDPNIWDNPIICGYDFDVLKEHFEVNMETFYSQEELGKEGGNRQCKLE